MLFIEKLKFQCAEGVCGFDDAEMGSCIQFFKDHVLSEWATACNSQYIYVHTLENQDRSYRVMLFHIMKDQTCQVLCPS